MAWKNTGIQRCKTVTIDRRFSDSGSLPGYPKNYSILSAFTAASGSFGAITDTQFQRLSTTDYNTRLAAFKSYVQGVEGIPSVDAVTQSGYEAYKTNTTTCPIGG